MPHTRVLCASYASAKCVDFPVCGSASSIASVSSIASASSIVSARSVARVRSIASSRSIVSARSVASACSVASVSSVYACEYCLRVRVLVPVIFNLLNRNIPFTMC